jgi:hypothetical protein
MERLAEILLDGREAGGHQFLPLGASGGPEPADESHGEAVVFKRVSPGNPTGELHSWEFESHRLQAPQRPEARSTWPSWPTNEVRQPGPEASTHRALRIVVSVGTRSENDILASS